MGTGPARRVVIPFALALAILGSAWPAVACITPGKPPGLASATVERVSDGDTVRLRFPDGRQGGLLACQRAVREQGRELWR
jgi:endonuclease YncB( thermonuclease family)